MINGAVIHCGLLAAEGALSVDLVRAWDTDPTYSALGTACFLVPCKGREEGVMPCTGTCVSVIAAAGSPPPRFDGIQLPSWRVLETPEEGLVFRNPILPFHSPPCPPFHLRLIH